MNLEYLKEFRKKNYPTATAFARKIGCPQSTYYYVELGKTELSCGQLQKIMELHPDFDAYCFLESENQMIGDLHHDKLVLIEKVDKLEMENQDLKNHLTFLSDKAEKGDSYKDELLKILLEERKRERNE